MQQQDIRPGDVLLTRGDNEKWAPGRPIRERIAATTDSPYTHAAVALNSHEIVDARPGAGVKIRSFTSLLAEAECVAVFRHPDAWDEARVQALQEYAASLQALGAKYNYRDVLRFEENKAQHQAAMTEALEAFFKAEEEGGPQVSTDFRAVLLLGIGRGLLCSWRLHHPRRSRGACSQHAFTRRPDQGADLRLPGWRYVSPQWIRTQAG